MYKSPYTNSIEDEDFITTIKAQMAAIIDGDEDLCQLLNVLVLFSPLDVEMSQKEKDLWKNFQQKISMMIYTHLMQRCFISKSVY